MNSPLPAPTPPQTSSQMPTQVVQDAATSNPMASMPPAVSDQNQFVSDQVVADSTQPISDQVVSDRPQPLQPPQAAPVADLVVPADSLPQLDDRPQATMFAQSLPTVLAEDTSSLNPPAPRPSAKEKVVSVVDQRVDLPAGVSAIESEMGAEMPPEVQKYVEEIKKHDDQIPQEIVIADQALTPNMATPMAQPVIILPMTEEEIRVGKRAPVQSSTRWLAEFTEKIIKMFAGQVIFRQEPS